MEKEDARFQTLVQLHERRKQVARLHCKGFKVMQIVAMTGLSYPTVRRTIDLYDQQGLEAIRPALRGRARGQGRVLGAAQEQAILRSIIDARPEQLQMDFALWSRAAVGRLIERETGIRLPVRTVGKYLTRWGFTPQKPAAGQSWLHDEYPAIEQRARSEGAEIHWGDETALVNIDARATSDAPVGKTPTPMTVHGRRPKLSMLATVTNQGKARWMIIDEALDEDRLIEFLQALIEDVGRKVFLILDELRVHHGKKVKAWVAQRQEQIELLHVPG